MKSRNWFYTALLCFLVIFLSACQPDETTKALRTPPPSELTLIMYMPWSTNLTSYFVKNIADMEQAIQSAARSEVRVICFFATSATQAELFEMRSVDGVYQRTTITMYEQTTFSDPEDFASFLWQVKEVAPSNRYAMIVSAHGMGWVPKDQVQQRSFTTPLHWYQSDAFLTRFFGGFELETQMDVVDFAKGIELGGVYMDYILFDDCYMANVEVAYDLRQVTDYLIASPTEIMAHGFPYDLVGADLLGSVDWQAVVDGYHHFYSTYQFPYGTIGVIHTRELMVMASLMREVNRRFTWDQSRNHEVQRMDGYSPTIFYDFGSYVQRLCQDSILLDQVEQSLDRLVPMKSHTPFFYSMSNGTTHIKEYAGITISDLSVNPLAGKKEQTHWYQATH